MTAVLISNYNKHLQDCLSKYLKVFENDIHSSDNPVYNAIINRKLKFIKWILKAIKSNENIQYEMLIIMIDTEIILYKRRLGRARTRPMTDKAFDTIQHLEWLRNVLKSTHRNGFTAMIFY